ncbi:hypothetical protein [Sodalis glossinidius]|uniref:hypothetical protein n=1 Tax=Sodalis glossinidius TaxID=63612 RepID=UPI00031DA9AA|nr:hypothetical protein [Sodalis glossinidius]
MRAHPQRWAELQAKEANISPDVARLAASRVGGQFVPVDAALDNATDPIADNFYRLGIIDHATDVSPVFDARYSAFLQQQLQEKK